MAFRLAAPSKLISRLSLGVLPQLGARAGKIVLLNGAESSAQYVPLQYAVTNEIDIVSVC